MAEARYCMPSFEPATTNSAIGKGGSAKTVGWRGRLIWGELDP
jgi:hypothetical protein